MVILSICVIRRENLFSRDANLPGYDKSKETGGKLSFCSFCCEQDKKKETLPNCIAHYCPGQVLQVCEAEIVTCGWRENKQKGKKSLFFILRHTKPIYGGTGWILTLEGISTCFLWALVIPGWIGCRDGQKKKDDYMFRSRRAHKDS